MNIKDDESEMFTKFKTENKNRLLSNYSVHYERAKPDAPKSNLDRMPENVGKADIMVRYKSE